MKVLAIALVGLLFLPVSASAPIAHATTVEDSGEDPSPRLAAAVNPSAAPLTVRLTSYNAVAWQTDSTPGVTASGISSNPEVIAARSRDLASTLPFGTVVAIYRDGSDSPSCGFRKVEHLIGYRVVADTMNARFTKRVDVELDAADRVSVGGVKMNPSRALGVCGNVKVRVIGRIENLSDIPSTQEELQALVEASYSKTKVASAK